MKKFLRRFERQSNVLAFGVEPSTCRYRLGLARYPDMAMAIRAEAGTKKRLELLDVGCGKGKLIQYTGGLDITFTGLDISAKSLKISQDKGYHRVCQANVSNGLPFEDGSYDVVVCSHIIEHLLEPESLVAEARRVLRPGGILIVGVPMHTRWVRWLRIHLVPLLQPHKRREAMIASFGHVQFFTLSTLRFLFDDFAIEDIRGFRFFSAGRYLPLENWRWYYRLNTWWGRHFPNVTAEVNVIARKPASATQRPAGAAREPQVWAANAPTTIAEPASLNRRRT